MQWPDWRGECVAIVASGPSTKAADVAKLRNRIHVIAIKKNIELCPWADVVYGCDAAWWKSVRGLPQSNALKLAWDDGVVAQYGLHKIDVDKKVDRLMLQQPGHVGAGGNSGFQAFNLAVQFGVRGILLVGFDMHGRSGAHWYGRNSWPKANNPTDSNYERWRKAFENAASDLAAMDVQVFNAAPHSVLRCFPFKTIEQALDGWGL